MNEEEIRKQVDELYNALILAKEKIVEQDEMLKQLASPPMSYAVVIATSPAKRPDPKKDYRIGTMVRVIGGPQKGRQGEITGALDADGDVFVSYEGGDGNYHRVIHDEVSIKIIDWSLSTATIAVDGKFFEVLLPENYTINPGDTVTVVMESMQITGIATTQLNGDIGHLRRVIDATFSEVDYQSSVRVVFNGKLGTALEKGDRVVLDGSATVIVRNLGKEDERFSFAAETSVSWAEIGGLEEAKRQMIEAVELPHSNQDLFRYYGKRPIKGVLLYGPPGCGKTMLGKATATSLARIYNGGKASAGFIYIKGPEILDKFVGVAEATIRQIFQRARKHKETHGYPAVVFIDEADAILARRGSGVSSDVERTIVPMFLTEMDGLEESGALVILATNRPDILDPAVVRDGRIDRKIRIDRPTPKSATEIFLLALKRVPLSKGYSHEELAELGSAEIFSPRRVFYQVCTNGNGTLGFTLGHTVNGGMIVSVVDQATSIAMHRDLAAKKKQGLRKEDIVTAVDAVERQNRDLNHSDELAEFVHDYREDIVNIRRLRQSAA
ncbi:MAG: AAA family ATPase [Candidatus Kerfeldbacteria bacterium]|nr:AAA family ATPase [Candidatus Kerfeldbacteria bacterium]